MTTQTAHATGTYSDTSTGIIDNEVTWTATDAGLLTIGATTGIATPTAAALVFGAMTGITASLSGVVGSADVHIIALDSGTIRMPLVDAHWVDAGLSPWGTTFGLQEATGSCIGSGSAGYTLTAKDGATSGAGKQYRQAVTNGNWNRVGIQCSGGLGEQLVAVSGVGPNVNATSTAWLAYMIMNPGPTFNYSAGIIGSVAANRLAVATDGAVNSIGNCALNCQNKLKNVTGPYMRMDDRVHPYLLVYNRTSQEAWLATDNGIMMSGGIALGFNDDLKGFGGPTSAASPSATFVYFASATGSIVEPLASPSGAADFLTRLGWTVSWKGCPTDSGTIKLPFTQDHWKNIGCTPWAAAFNCTALTGQLTTIDNWAGTNQDGWALTQNINVIHQYQEKGWSRSGVLVKEIANARFNNSNNLIGSYTGSAAFLAYARLGTVTGAARHLFGGGTSGANGSRFFVHYDVNGIPALSCSGTLTSGTIDHRDSRVHPFLIVYDVTNSRAKLYTDLAKHTGTYGVLNVTPTIGLGSLFGAAAFAATASFVYFAVCTGSTAVTLSDDGQASVFLKNLGWNLSW